VGKVHPSAAGSLPDCYLFELRLSALFKAMRPTLVMREIPRFPAVRRDIAVVVGKDVEAAAMITALKNASCKEFVSAEVFDVYEGDAIGAGKKSVAIKLSFQDYEKTLESIEIDQFVEKLMKNLSRETGAVLRS
jgi:phenylalanyl-tRNA synthetase beta chain